MTTPKPPATRSEALGPIVLLDRDGVLNAMVIDAEHGTIDSPLHPDQVHMLAGVPQAVAQLCAAGCRLHIVTNQPAHAKGKTTLANLQAVHARIVAACESAGGRIVSSHLCLHRAEDGCACRKPKTGLLVEALAGYGGAVGQAWMVGDGVTDIAAGKALGLKTAFLGPRKCDACKILESQALTPDLWLSDLTEFTERMVSDD